MYLCACHGVVHQRLKTASYFQVGMNILYGKYKNGVAILRGFGVDKWGNPTVIVEPQPLGRKKPKVLGLFKIWRADVVEKAKAEAAAKAIAVKVAARYVAELEAWRGR